MHDFFSNRILPAGSPAELVPALRTTVDDDGKIVVAISCVSEAEPPAVMSWSRGSEALAGVGENAVNSLLLLRDYNVSNFLLHNYTCVARNPLGSTRQEIQLRGTFELRDSALCEVTKGHLHQLLTPLFFFF